MITVDGAILQVYVILFHMLPDSSIIVEFKTWSTKTRLGMLTGQLMAQFLIVVVNSING